ncbi:hypothetical protein FACS1894159_12140 [Bacteroidia bacterium]|nr:hypothetical protein FACS1894159_12140 [Bacteroidia bacterium]
MKRPLAILLLIIALFASTHATLALHYCGGRLHSLVVPGSSQSSCCKGGHHHDQSDTLRSSSCCTELWLQTGVDDLSSLRQDVAGDRAPLAAIVLFHFRTPGDLSAVPAPKRVFAPPGPLARSGSERQAMISLFRI